MARSEGYLAGMYKHCVQSLRSFVHKAGFSEVVIGLSGGIDSALVATMAVDAFGARNVHAVLLPGPYSSESSVNDALDLAQRQGIETRTISITEPFEAFSQVLHEACGEEGLAGLAAENTQARCRMVCLMALSNTYGWMLLNTGNKSEAYMGYSTLYGDTAGAFAPLGSLFKTDVFALSHWVNAQARAAEKVEPIPSAILMKPPSAELSPGQTDEASLGINYEDLDIILKDYEASTVGVCLSALDPSENEIFVIEDLYQEALSALPTEEIKRVRARVEAMAFKRSYAPPCPSAYDWFSRS